MTWIWIALGSLLLWLAGLAAEYRLRWREFDRIWQALREEAAEHSVLLTRRDGTREWMYVAPRREEDRQ